MRAAVSTGHGTTFEPGVLSADAGHAAYETIVRAVRDAQAGGIQAIATAPINKEALALAGLPWRGHTEMLADADQAARGRDDVLVREAARRAGDDSHSAREVPAALTLESVDAISSS